MSRFIMIGDNVRFRVDIPGGPIIGEGVVTAAGTLTRGRRVYTVAVTAPPEYEGAAIAIFPDEILR